jgi:dTDP-4-amino-4,6-dideoxygalactose transaminase
MEFTISRTPLLRWKNVLPRVPAARLPVPASAHSVYHSFFARNAIYHGLKALRISAGDSVLVPSFHCAALVEPVVKRGAGAVFYNVRWDCTLDIQDIESKIDESTRAILAVHYFGFPQVMRPLLELCRKYNLYLIEDCAHVLAGKTEEGTLGSFGDISVFSWRKCLPIYDGGSLVINARQIRYTFPTVRSGLTLNLKAAKFMLEGLSENSWLERNSLASGMIKTIMAAGKGLRTKLPAPEEYQSVNNYDLVFDPAAADLAMTPLSRYVTRNLDVNSIVKSIRENYRYLAESMRTIGGITLLHANLPKGVCPLAVPFFAEKTPDFHVALRERGIPAYTWGGVVHPSLEIEQFPDASFLYDKLILLPVHQTLTYPEMDTMVQTVKSLLL